MKTTQRGPGIFWMVRLLWGSGLCDDSCDDRSEWFVAPIDTDQPRAAIREEQEHLRQPTREILQSAEEARREIQGRSTHHLQKTAALTCLAQAADKLSQSTDDPSAS